MHSQRDAISMQALNDLERGLNAQQEELRVKGQHLALQEQELDRHRHEMRTLQSETSVHHHRLSDGQQVIFREHNRYVVSSYS